MRRSVERLSLLSHALDRAAFLAYFLGAVVPFAGLTWLVATEILPHLDDPVRASALIALVASLGALSLGSFLLLRHVTRRSLARLDEDRRRLEQLLEVSRSVAAAPYADELLRGAVAFAAELAGAPRCFVLQRSEKDDTWSPAGGDEASLALYRSARGAFDEIAELSASHARPLLQQAASDEPVAVAAVPVVEGERAVAVIVAARDARAPAFHEAELSSLSTLAALVSVGRHNAELRDAQRNFFAHVTEMLIAALDAHMEVQSGHSHRVAHIADLLGHELGFDDRRLERLHFAALLHDIGMLKIHPTLMGNRSANKQHPMLGFRMLKPIRLWQDLAPMILHHHEWFDGNGYPEGLRGEDIPLESRIIGLAEAFDSMTSQRSYRSPLPVEEALRRIREGAGTQFDPTVARLFTELVERGAVRIESQS